MLTSVRRVFVHGGNSILVQVFSTTHNPRFLQSNPFSAAPTEPISKPPGPSNFTADYLVNQLGFPPEKALSASKNLRFKSPEKPDAVVAFLKSNGFTHQQIASMARQFPALILCDPQKTLKPKIDYFRSSGISDTDVADVFVSTPHLFSSSLEKQIGPNFDCLRGLFESNGHSLTSFKRLPRILRCDFGSTLLPNVDILREAGVGYTEILHLLEYQPRAFMVGTEKFREVVSEVKRMGFDPSRFKFVVAVLALRSMTKLNWENKLGVYMRWGWSRDECIAAFLKQPFIMVKSEEHITKVMDLLINKMGFKPSLVSKTPYVLSYSFERRVRPRCLVLKFLWDNGLKKRRECLPNFSIGVVDFLKAYVLKYEEKAPELLKLYEKESASSMIY